MSQLLTAGQIVTDATGTQHEVLRTDGWSVTWTRNLETGRVECHAFGDLLVPA